MCHGASDLCWPRGGQWLPPPPAPSLFPAVNRALVCSKPVQFTGQGSKPRVVLGVRYVSPTRPPPAALTQRPCTALPPGVRAAFDVGSASGSVCPSARARGVTRETFRNLCRFPGLGPTAGVWQHAVSARPLVQRLCCFRLPVLPRVSRGPRGSPGTPT